jgi:hypothetical protein
MPGSQKFGSISLLVFVALRLCASLASSANLERMRSKKTPKNRFVFFEGVLFFIIKKKSMFFVNTTDVEYALI